MSSSQEQGTRSSAPSFGISIVTNRTETPPNTNDYTPLSTTTTPSFQEVTQTPILNSAYQRLQRRHLHQYLFVLFLIPIITFISAIISISLVGGTVTYGSFGTLLLVSIIVMILETFKITIVVAILTVLVVLCFLVTVQMNLKSNREHTTQNNDALTSRSTRAFIAKIVSNLTCESLFIGPIMSRFEFYLKRNLFCTVAAVLFVVLTIFIITCLLLSTLIVQFTSWLVHEFHVDGFSDLMKISFIMFLVNLGMLLWGTCVRLFCWKSNPNAPVDPSDSYASDMIQQLRQQFEPLVMSPNSDEEYTSDDDFI